MTKPKPLTFDVSRLLSLAKARDLKQAVVRGLNDDRLDLREQRLSLTRDAMGFRHRVSNNRHGASSEIMDAKKSTTDEIIRQDTLLAKNKARMDEVQDEITAAGAQLFAASELFEACLAFAKQNGLKIPETLTGA